MTWVERVEVNGGDYLCAASDLDGCVAWCDRLPTGERLFPRQILRVFGGYLDAPTPVTAANVRAMAVAVVAHAYGMPPSWVVACLP